MDIGAIAGVYIVARLRCDLCGLGRIGERSGRENECCGDEELGEIW